MSDDCKNEMDALYKEKAELQGELEKLNNSLDALRRPADDLFNPVPLSTCAKDANVTTKQPKFKKRRDLASLSKIASTCWASDSRHVAVADQQGKLVVFNAYTTSKELFIVPKNKTWYMFCEFSPDDKLLAAGGLDNNCTIFKLNGLGDDPDAGANVQPICVLEKHIGFIGDAKWIDQDKILTCSGDKSMILWDINTKKPIETFRGHKQDVHNSAIIDSNTWVTCSADTTAKLWDRRARGIKCVATFQGHENKVNDIKLYPDKKAFGTASEDGTCRLFDIRSLKQMNIYADEDNRTIPANSTEFNQDGSIIFAGDDEGNIVTWDVLSGEFVDELMGHEAGIANVRRSPDGKAFVSASKATDLIVWA